MNKKKDIDIDNIRQDNIAKEMLKMGITPHNVEISKNGSGFKFSGNITEEQKRHIEKFAVDQYKIWNTIEEIVKYESGNWAKFCRDNNLPRDFKLSLKKYIEKAPKFFSPFGLRQSITDK